MGKASITASYNGRLTTYAQGLSQDLARATASFLAPDCPVAASIGQYKSYDEKNAFQVVDTARAVGGGAARLRMEATDPFYNCLPQALEIPIDDSEYDAAGDLPGAVQALEESKVKTLLTTARISHEDKVIAFAKANVAAVGGVGVWSAGANKPIDEIDAQIEAISTALGMMPNRLLIGLPAWRILRNHPEVLKRFPGAASVGVTLAQFSSLLLNPAIEIQLGILSKDTAKQGKAASKANIIGADLFVFYGQSTPSIYDASFMKTFTTRAGSVDAVREYREESSRSEVKAIDWSEDVQVTAAVAAKRITVS